MQKSRWSLFLVLLSFALFTFAGCEEAKKKDADTPKAGEASQTNNAKGNAATDKTAKSADGKEKAAKPAGAQSKPVKAQVKKVAKGAATDAVAPAATESEHLGCGAGNLPAPNDPKIPAGTTVHYGTPFTVKTDAITMADAVSKIDDLAGKTILVKAPVNTVCRAKGCWMQVGAGEGVKPVRVTFKDYGFFVPKNCDGNDALMEGTIKLSVVTETMRRHYAADGGKSEQEIQAIKGDTKTIKFVAVAVDLTAPK